MALTPSASPAASISTDTAGSGTRPAHAAGTQGPGEPVRVDPSRVVGLQFSPHDHPVLSSIKDNWRVRYHRAAPLTMAARAGWFVGGCGETQGERVEGGADDDVAAQLRERSMGRTSAGGPSGPGRGDR